MEGLQAQIRDLQARLDAAAGSAEPDQVSRPVQASSFATDNARANGSRWADDVRDQAEELGALVVGGFGGSAEKTYGMLIHL